MRDRATEVALFRYAPSTVRNWLRAFRANAERLRVLGSQLAITLLSGEDVDLAVDGGTTGAAIDALGAAARGPRLATRPARRPWAESTTLTAGTLLGPRRT